MVTMDSRSIEVPKSSLSVLGLAALGVVFGDIGTSPLYTFKSVLDFTGTKPVGATIIGSASLILWTLFIITSIKYVGFAMRRYGGARSHSRILQPPSSRFWRN
jgi:KUP system potassium uptake protein